jgi:polyribonucleotide nucleotidyltransferase
MVARGMDDRGKVKLSMKRVDQENGEIIGELPSPDEVSAPRPRREGGDRDRGRGGRDRDRGPRRESGGRR